LRTVGGKGIEGGTEGTRGKLGESEDGEAEGGRSGGWGQVRGGGSRRKNVGGSREGGTGRGRKEEVRRGSEEAEETQGRGKTGGGKETGEGQTREAA